MTDLIATSSSNECTEVTEKHKKKHLLQTMLYESNWLYLLTKNIIDPAANIPYV